MSPNDISKCLLVVMAVIVIGAIIAERYLPTQPLTHRTHAILLTMAIAIPIGLGIAATVQLDTVSVISVLAMIVVPCLAGGATLVGCRWRDGRVSGGLDDKARAAAIQAEQKAREEADHMREAVLRDG